MNTYIKPSSLWSFPITPKYHPILFNKIGIQKPFIFYVFQFISVYSMKRTYELFFITGFILFAIQYRSSLPPSLKYKNMPFPTQILSQFESNDWQLFFEESKISIYDCFGIFLSFGLASEVPKLNHYGVVLFHPQA